MDAAAKALLDENAVLKAQLAVALAKASEDTLGVFSRPSNSLASKAVIPYL